MKHIGEMLAQKQLDAYNKQDLEQFLSVYSNEVIIMEFPSNNVTSQGIEEMRLRYGKLFKENPAEVFRRAVYGMLPKNKLRAKMIKRLEISDAR